jgi:hypothetical protein
MIVVPDLGGYEHILSAQTAFGHGSTHVRFVAIHAGSIDKAIPGCECIQASSLGLASQWHLIYPKAKDRHLDVVVQFHPGSDVDLHVSP